LDVSTTQIQLNVTRTITPIAGQFRLNLLPERERQEA
jgi:hypothetical protein